jgi:hypothetical protein
MIGAAQNQLAISSSLTTVIDRLSASVTTGASLGTPGLITMREQSKARSLCRSVSNAMFAAESCIVLPVRLSALRLSLTNTSAPCRDNSMAAPTPLRAAPIIEIFCDVTDRVVITDVHLQSCGLSGAYAATNFLSFSVGPLENTKPGTLMLCLSHFECCKADDHQQNSNDVEPHNNFRFRNALHLKMMMQRSHAEHPPAFAEFPFCVFEIETLDDH